MKSTKTIINEILNRLNDIETDERLHSKLAAVQINAPLACIQIDLKAKATAFREVLRKFDAEPPVVKFHQEQNQCPEPDYGNIAQDYNDEQIWAGQPTEYD